MCPNCSDLRPGLDRDQLERDWHRTVADFLEELDKIAAFDPEIAAHSLRFIADEAAMARWSRPAA